MLRPFIYSAFCGPQPFCIYTNDTALHILQGNLLSMPRRSLSYWQTIISPQELLAADATPTATAGGGGGATAATAREVQSNL